jgi:hypothetical protein
VLAAGITHGDLVSLSGVFAKHELTAIWDKEFTRSNVVNYEELIQIVHGSNHDQQLPAVNDLVFYVLREHPFAGAREVIGRAWKYGQIRTINFEPSFPWGESAPVNKRTPVRRIHSISCHYVRGGCASDVLQNGSYFYGFPDLELLHLTGEHSDIGALTGIELRSSDTGIDPRADNCPSRETVITLCLAVLCFLVSAVFLEYGLWNVYYGPINWLADFAVIGGFIPFMLGLLLIFSLAS